MSRRQKTRPKGRKTVSLVLSRLQHGSKYKERNSRHARTKGFDIVDVIQILLDGLLDVQLNTRDDTVSTTIISNQETEKKQNRLHAERKKHEHISTLHIDFRFKSIQLIQICLADHRRYPPSRRMDARMLF
jgi:hypothetical protein